ncbi:hypothetical protein HQ560_14675, partial [bacterium]|nr:hypothetical protein [bacterium]
WGAAGRLMNTTGRNDFVTLKVAADATNVYFYAQTRERITPSKDAHWMELYIDADADAKTGWEGYDFVVNRRVLNASRTYLHRLSAAAPPQVVTTLAYAVKGNELEIAVPRTALGLAGKGAFTLDFHWADNIQKAGDILEFARHGDSAPDRRFKYRFIRK